MKIREGFVSNSSSSSFIVHNSAFESQKQRDEFVNELMLIRNKFADEYDCWGESGETFRTEGNFILIESYSAPEELFEILCKYDINGKNPNVFDIY